ncbi:cupredoxin domain-containing protein [Pseudarthrobacter sp. Fe7]|nr:cupredoxin domain-containing protein [Pseudarthrobacter sp. Fe7]
MKTTTIRQRLTLAVIGAATIIGATACGSGGTGTGTSAAPSTVAGSAGASMDPGMDLSASPMASSTPSSMPSAMGATTGSSSGSTGTAAESTIHIKSFAYSGAGTVPAGSTVTVMNMDNQAHTVTADDGSFDAVVKAGTSITFTAPAKPGTYTYHCTYHSNMHGTLTVK